MGVNFQHLRAFHAIASDGGVSRAARRLNVSQPTLSQQLKALEARHGVTLFESRKAPLRLTACGRDLFALTSKFFAVAIDIEERLGERGSLSGGVLRLGSDNPTYAAWVVKAFREQFPQHGIKVRIGNARDVMGWLADAQVDAALASDPPGDGAFSYQPLASDSLCCAVPKGHTLAALDIVPVKTLAGETLLIREPNSKTRAFAERVMADADVQPLATIELHSRETIREAIAQGLGISIFFSSECPPDPRLVYRPFASDPRRYVLQSYLVCRSERRRSAQMRALQAIAASHFSDSEPPSTRYLAEETGIPSSESSEQPSALASAVAALR